MAGVIDKSRDHDSHGEEKVFEQYLRAHGLKYTTSRKNLLHAIFAMHDHFTADQLIDRLKERKLGASKATVYRTLAVMLACNLLEMHDFGEGSRYYEHTYGHPHHDHLFCVNCKVIVEFRDDGIERLQTKAAERAGFELLAHTLKMYGLCKDCRRDPEARPRHVDAVHRG